MQPRRCSRLRAQHRRRTEPSAASLDLVVLGRDAGTGAAKWSFRLPHRDQSYAHHVVADPDGDLVYATSHDYAAAGECVRRPATVALDQRTGAHAWTVRESAPDGGCVSLYSTAVDPDGERLFVVAGTEGTDGRLEQTLVARDADTGEMLWSRSVAAPDELLGATGSTLAVSPDGGRVYAGGSLIKDVSGMPAHVAWLLQGYDTATGERVFDRTWDAPRAQSSGPANPPAAMAVAPDGSTLYAVGGVEHVAGRMFDITAISFDTASGEQRWLYRYDGPRQKSSFDSVWFNGPIALSADGSRLAIAGYGTHFAVGVNLQLDLVTMLLDTTTGRARWETRYTSESETNWVPSVALSPDASRVYVAAPSRYAAVWQAPARYTALAYRADTGAVAWTARHSDGHSFAQGSALTPDGSRFVVTGMTADAGPQTASGVNWGMGLVAYTTQ